MDKDIKAAVDYVMNLVGDKSIPLDALRMMIEDRIRMACADTLRWQAGMLQTAAGNLTARK
jgi:hypothetical protein